MANNECKPKKSKAMDMRYNWLICRTNQGQFNVKWVERDKNIADFFTKDLPPDTYRHMRQFLIPKLDRRVSVNDLLPVSSQKRVNDGRVCERGVLTTEKSLPPKDTATHKPQPYKPSSVVWPRGTKFNTS